MAAALALSGAALVSTALANPSRAKFHRFKHHPECRTRACARHADHLWAVHHPPPRPRWVIPEAIVICESKGVNLAPNSASAAGYYQIISSTWAENGGSPPDDASQHSKAEQDQVAARIWASAGPGAWVCKA